MPLAVAVAVFFGLAIYWSIPPDIFDVREVALRQSANDPKKLVPGAVTTATLIEVTTTLLEKRGGFLSNDINPVSLWLDNMPIGSSAHGCKCGISHGCCATISPVHSRSRRKTPI